MVLGSLLPVFAHNDKLASIVTITFSIVVVVILLILLIKYGRDDVQPPPDLKLPHSSVAFMIFALGIIVSYSYSAFETKITNDWNYIKIARYICLAVTAMVETIFLLGIQKIIKDQNRWFIEYLASVMGTFNVIVAVNVMLEDWNLEQTPLFLHNILIASFIDYRLHAASFWYRILFTETTNEPAPAQVNDIDPWEIKLYKYLCGCGK